MRKAQYILIMLIAMGTVGCNRFCRGDYPSQQPVFLEIKKDGKIVSDSVLKGAELYWIENGVKKYENEKVAGVDINDPSFGIKYAPTGYETVDSSRPLLRTVSASDISATKGIKDFYIEYKDGSNDAVFIDYQQNTGEENHCKYTNNVFRAIKFRGADPPVDSSMMNQYQYQPIYIINK